MNTVPFVDLRAQYAELKEAIDAGMQSVIGNTSYILGGELTQFEKNFADYCGTKYSIGVASGLDALSLSLKALDIGPGDEVITTPNTFIATVCAISAVGAKPVLVDCEKETYNLDPSKLEEVITPKTKAIIPVHLYGQLANMDEILKIAQKHNLRVVEDACQAHGAIRDGKKAGTFGDFGCFSFYPAKNLGAFGDGGGIVTNSEELTEKIKLIRHYGQAVKNIHTIPGINSRLDTLHAAILDAKLPHLDDWNQRRRDAAILYNELLSSLPVVIPNNVGNDHVYHLYVIRVKNRDEVIEKLSAKNIQCGTHYPTPIHLQKAYEDLGYKKGSFPVAEEYANEIVSLPMFPQITEEQVKQVAAALKEIL